MSLKRFATRRDSTEPAILRALAKAGADYILLDAFDVLVLYRGILTMLECKAPKGRHTRNQDVLVDRGWPVRFVKTPEEALAAIGVVSVPLHICRQPGYSSAIHRCLGCESGSTAAKESR